MLQRILLLLDWRREARDVRGLLREPNFTALENVRIRLVESPHNYPDGLLRILRAEMPKLSFCDQNSINAAEDLHRTIEWETYARNQSLAM